MADASYDAEVSGIQAFLSMQHDKGDATPLNPGQVCIGKHSTHMHLSHMQNYFVLSNFILCQ